LCALFSNISTMLSVFIIKPMLFCFSVFIPVCTIRSYSAFIHFIRKTMFFSTEFYLPIYRLLIWSPYRDMNISCLCKLCVEFNEVHSIVMFKVLHSCVYNITASSFKLTTVSSTISSQCTIRIGFGQKRTFHHFQMSPMFAFTARVSTIRLLLFVVGSSRRRRVVSDDDTFVRF